MFARPSSLSSRLVLVVDCALVVGKDGLPRRLSFESALFGVGDELAEHDEVEENRSSAPEEPGRIDEQVLRRRARKENRLHKCP